MRGRAFEERPVESVPSLALVDELVDVCEPDPANETVARSQIGNGQEMPDPRQGTRPAGLTEFRQIALRGVVETERPS